MAEKVPSLSILCTGIVCLAVGGCNQGTVSVRDPQPAAVLKVDPTWPSQEERRMQPDHAPTPFTAEQIRRGCPEGRTVTWRMEPLGADPFLQIFRFTGVDAEGASVVSTRAGLDGSPMADGFKETAGKRGKWAEFQAHASFPASDTQIREEDLELLGVRYQCIYYRVARDQRVSEFWFAKQLPGPPIQMIERQGDQIDLRMTLVENRAGP